MLSLNVMHKTIASVRDYFSLNYSVLIAIAVIMALIGGWLCNLFLLVSIPLYSYAVASCLTWFVLAGSVKNHSVITAIIVGLFSPFLGAGILGAVAYFHEYGLSHFRVLRLVGAIYGFLVYGSAFIVLRSYIVLPVGILTALLLRRLLSDATKLA